MNNPDAPNRSAASQRWKSCALGCLVSLAAVILLSVGAYYWLKTPGLQIPTETFIGNQTLGVLHIEGLRDDPALLSLTRNILGQLQQAHKGALEQEDVPPLLKVLAGWNRRVGDDEAREAIEGLPRDLTATLEEVEGSQEPQYLVTANLSRFPRALRLIYSFMGIYQQAEGFQGIPIVQPFPREDFHLAFVEQTLLVSPSPPVLRLAILRASEASSPVSSRVLSTYRRRDRQWAIYGFLENRAGSYEWLARRLPDWAGAIVEFPAESVTLTADVPDGNSIAAQIEVEYSSIPDAEGAAAAMQAWADNNRERWDWLGLGVSRAGHYLRLDLALNDVTGLFEEALHKTP